MSEGEIELSAGWVEASLCANWKMLPEMTLTGYHVGFTSLADESVARSTSGFVGEEKNIKGILRDWGTGTPNRVGAGVIRTIRVVCAFCRKAKSHATLAGPGARDGKEKARQRCF